MDQNTKKFLIVIILCLFIYLLSTGKKDNFILSDFESDLKNCSNNNANSVKDIDDVFIKIRQIYNKSEFNIIYHNLLMLEKNPEHYETYMQGINASMHPVNLQIKKWINDNIVY